MAFVSEPEPKQRLPSMVLGIATFPFALTWFLATCPIEAAVARLTGKSLYDRRAERLHRKAVRLLSSPDSGDRLKGLRALSKVFIEKEAIPLLLRAVKDSDRRVQLKAIDVLHAWCGTLPSCSLRSGRVHDEMKPYLDTYRWCFTQDDELVKTVLKSLWSTHSSQVYAACCGEEHYFYRNLIAEIYAEHPERLARLGVHPDGEPADTSILSPCDTA